MPPHAYRYAIPKFLYTDHNVRRYGFHGTSHAYVSDKASELAGNLKRWMVNSASRKRQFNLRSVEWTKC